VLLKIEISKQLDGFIDWMIGTIALICYTDNPDNLIMSTTLARTSSDHYNRLILILNITTLQHFLEIIPCAILGIIIQYIESPGIPLIWTCINHYITKQFTVPSIVPDTATLPCDCRSQYLSAWDRPSDTEDRLAPGCKSILQGCFVTDRKHCIEFMRDHHDAIKYNATILLKYCIDQYVMAGPLAPGTLETGPEAPGTLETGPEAPGTLETGPEAPGTLETGPEAPGTLETGPGPARPAGPRLLLGVDFWKDLLLKDLDYGNPRYGWIYKIYTQTEKLSIGCWFDYMLFTYYQEVRRDYFEKCEQQVEAMVEAMRAEDALEQELWEAQEVMHDRR
jgi:hypothetical protein